MSDFLGSLPEAARAYLDGHVLDEVECFVSDIAGVVWGKAMFVVKFVE